MVKSAKSRRLCPSHDFVPLKGGPQCGIICRLCKKRQKIHCFCAHPTELYKIKCLHCNQHAKCSMTDTYDNKLIRYLSARRKLRLIEHLYSLSLPVSPMSALFLDELMKTFHIISKTSILHVTLLEGVPAGQNFDDYLYHVFEALQNIDNSCRVIGVQSLPTANQEERLIILNVQFEALSQTSHFTAVPTTRMPQWPMLHLSLGTTHENDNFILENLERACVGHHLHTNPASLTWLAPNYWNTKSCRDV